MRNREATFSFLNSFQRKSINYYFEAFFLLVVKLCPL